MAVLAFTGLETVPAGVDGLVVIIDGNFAQIDALFDPANATALKAAFWKALARNATLPTDAARLEYDTTAGHGIQRRGFEALASGGTVDIDFKGAYLQRVDITADLTLTFSNLGIGRDVDLIIGCDATPRNLTFPGSIIWLTAMPASITASKFGRLKLRSSTTGAAGVFAEWIESP